MQHHLHHGEFVQIRVEQRLNNHNVSQAFQNLSTDNAARAGIPTQAGRFG